MNKLKSKRMLAGVLAACAFGGIALSLARATPGSGVMTTILTGPTMFDDIHAMSHTPDHTAVINTRGVSDVYIVHNKIAPGGHTGWHSHPGVSFVTVKSGVATEYHGDDPSNPKYYPAGTGLVEEAGRVHLFANEGTTDLELVAFQLLPFGATRRIDQPAP
jgi:quercetin dioxygenase-like cupin family protein